MAQFSSTNVKLRQTGQAASATFLIGSRADLAAVYVDSQGDPVNIDGWGVKAEAELYTGEWTNEDDLSNLEGDPLDGGAKFTLDARQDNDQDVNPGVFYVTVGPDTLPEARRNVHVDSTELPTLATWVTFSEGEPDGIIDQARVAIGFRRGSGSIGVP